MPQPITTVLTREELEREEDQRLAPYAMRSSGARRAVPLSREGRIFDYRTEFQRDRDRILHSRAFRRLRLKSHGGAFPPAERYRDRMSHTLEVSQLSRTVARGLGLNEDLVEAIALGHELGMPPFGWAGEAVLDSLLRSDCGGFRYNVQSLRVVDRLEKRYEHQGINLTDMTREGILKHAPFDDGTLDDGPPGDPAAIHSGWAPFFEAQVVSAVDEVACVVQDLDDGLRSGELDPGDVESVPIVRELYRRIKQAPSPAGKGRIGRSPLFRRANAINRGLTHMLVTGIIQHSRRALDRWSRAEAIESHEAFMAARPRLAGRTISMSARGRRLFEGLREFVARNLHQGPWLRGMAARARHLIGGLYQALMDDPRLAEDYLLVRFKKESGGPYLRDVAAAEIDAEIGGRYAGNPRFSRILADHIAGMTDLFLVTEHERLLGPPAMARPQTPGMTP